MREPAQAAAGPAVVHVEHQRRLRRDRRMQRAHRRLPGLEAHAADILAGALGRRQRHRAAVAGQHEAFLDPAGHRACTRSTELSTKRAVPPPAGSSPSTCQGSSAWRSSSVGAAQRDLADAREAELEVRREPGRVEAVAVAAQFLQHIGEILRDKMRQQEVVVDAGAPVHQAPLVRRLPERRDRGAHQQKLRRRHARVRRHLQRTEFDQAEPAGRWCPGHTACRCRTRCDACCRSCPPAGGGTSDRPARARPPASARIWENAISSSARLSCRASSIRGCWLVGPMNRPLNR